MKKSTIAILLVILVIVGIIVFGRGSNKVETVSSGDPLTASTTVSVPVSETVKVSGKLSEYKNEELGFSVKYPSAWEKNDLGSSVSFTAPIDKSQVSTVATLMADVSVKAEKCAFPPVTVIKDRGTLAVGDMSMNMISMQSTVQGRGYFNRIYTYQQSPELCYVFSFASVSKSLTGSGLTGSEQTQATNNNKAIIAAADADFTNMVKSFTLIQGPVGEDETQAAPTKK